MITWLQQIPAERVLLWVFLAGVSWSRLRAAMVSLRAHGERLGSLEDRVTAIEAQRAAEQRIERKATIEGLRGSDAR